MKHKRKPYWQRWVVRKAIKRRCEQLVQKHFKESVDFRYKVVSDYIDDVFAVRMYRYVRAFKGHGRTGRPVQMNKRELAAKRDSV